MFRLVAALFTILWLTCAASAQNIRTLSGSGAVVTTAESTSSIIVWVGTAPTTWAITLPTNPASGTTFHATTDTTLTTLVTVTAASGDTLVAAFTSQTLTANTTVVGWRFYGPTRTWYRIQ